MASFFHVASLLLPLLLIPYIASADNIKTKIPSDNLINEICNRSRNGTFCLQLLENSDNPTLEEISEASIESAQESAMLAYDSIQAFIKQQKVDNPSAPLDVYLSCLRNYARASDHIVEASKLFKNGAYEKLGADARAASAEAESCEKSYKQETISGNQTGEIEVATETFQDVCSILVVAFNMLISILN